MKVTIKKWVTAVVAVSLIIGLFLPTSAVADVVAWPTGPDVESESAIVIEATTGTVLYEKNADEIRYPASITKIMTTMLALEYCDLDETVTFSSNAVYLNEGDTSHIARDIGEEMTLEQCLYAVMLESANECAYAVAEHVADGDYEAFIDLMNEKAAALGCTNTHFNNANGLPDEEHVTTCRDMALIAQAAIANSTFRQIISTTRYTIPPTNKHEDETNLNNHHRMINNYKGSQYLYEYAIGGKTGYTVAAGNTLVTYAEKDGMLLICVVMKSTAQYADTINLFDYCFANYSLYNIVENETRFDDETTSSTLFGTAQAFAELDTDSYVVLPASASFSDTEVEVSYETGADDVLGTLLYTYNGRSCGSADVLLTNADGMTYSFGDITVVGAVENEAESVEETDTIVTLIRERLDALDVNGMMFGIIALCVSAAVLIVIIYFIQSRIRHFIRRRRSRERRYKVIKENKKWRSRRRRW